VKRGPLPRDKAMVGRVDPLAIALSFSDRPLLLTALSLFSSRAQRGICSFFRPDQCRLNSRLFVAPRNLPTYNRVSFGVRVSGPLRNYAPSRAFAPCVLLSKPHDAGLAVSCRR
jgi:hypothetical protein